MAALKGMVGAFVVSIEGRKHLYKQQRVVLKQLASAIRDAGPDALEPVLRDDFVRAETDAARERVIVDQVASLTDQAAIAWYQRLVGDIDPSEIGVWVPGSLPRVRGAEASVALDLAPDLDATDSAGGAA